MSVQPPAEGPVFDYPVDPGQLCDVVMKGGITSGVVYPLAICRLAEKFRLQNIGGTSAGAIAAAVAAASEYGRRHETGTSFKELEGLPAWLGEAPQGSDDSNLFNLFQPKPSARGLFAILVAAISHPKQTVAFEILLSALRNWWPTALVGATPGLALYGLVFVALADRPGVLSLVALTLALIGALALTALGALAVVGFRLYRRAPSILADNFFGLCSGRRPSDASPETPPALTEWLHDRIQAASGATSVLTFGDLWGGTDGPKEMDLSMITTCLTLGRPYRLPFAVEDDFFFDPQELTVFFPEVVVEQMKAKANGDPDGRLVPLPPPQALPVVLGARLSLSFPFLLSTVPLYRRSFTDDGRAVFTRCHFSDGGICSNFPIQLFDSPLPRWPTFGINLAGPIGADGIDVWMPDTNLVVSAGTAREVANVGSFVAAIRGAAQNWHDNSYVEMPGYRDRIAHIRFGEGEGGLNLNMPRALIDALSGRGERAGRKLVARFTVGVDDPGGQPTELNWNNHRHIRQRIAFAAIEEFLMQLAVGHTGDAELTVAPRRFGDHIPMADEQTYDGLLAAVNDPRRYADFDAGQRTFGAAMIALVIPLARQWAERRGRDLMPRVSPAMSVGRPEPAMDIRIIPPL
jgi:hypothetical protein